VLKPDEIADLRKLFQELGFRNVNAKQTSIPKHIVDWIMEEFEEEDEGQEIQEMLVGFDYVRIETFQGSFGFLSGSYPVMDIEGTGVTVQDLGHDNRAPSFLLSMGESEDIINFRKLLEEKSKTK